MSQVCQGSEVTLDSMDFQAWKGRRVIQDFWDHLDLQGELGQKDHLVYVETLAQFRSSPFQEAQGPLAQLGNQGCKENLGPQGHRESQDLVGQEVNQARMEYQEFLDQLEKKATKVVKERKARLDSMDCQARRGNLETLGHLQGGQP